MKVFFSNYVGIFICRVRRLFWSAPSFLRWRDQNFTPSVQAGSQPLPEVSWQHTYYTRYSNTHIRSINLSNDVFKRYTLMNATYFFEIIYFILGVFGIHLENLFIIITQVPMAAYNTYTTCDSKSYTFLCCISKIFM